MSARSAAQPEWWVEPQGSDLRTGRADHGRL